MPCVYIVFSLCLFHFISELNNISSCLCHESVQCQTVFQSKLRKCQDFFFKTVQESVKAVLANVYYERFTVIPDNGLPCFGIHGMFLYIFTAVVKPRKDVGFAHFVSYFRPFLKSMTIARNTIS